MSVESEYADFVAGYMAAVRRGDAEAVASMYTEDAILLEPGMAAIRGRPAILALYRDWLGDGVAVTSAIDSIQDGGEMLCGTGTFDSGSGPGNWLQVLKRQADGRLLIHRLCSNRI